MNLGDILSKDFLTEYIKKGNVLMLSPGKTAADNTFTLREGILTMFLDKETFERAGLVGKPHGVKGNRGQRPRWVVSYDLKSSSMLHGKNGFERLVSACENVLNQKVNWLFCNVARSNPVPDPLSKHFPVRFESTPAIHQPIKTKTVPLTIHPSILSAADRPGLEEWASELYEWMSLVRLGSPRIEAQDSIDSYLSRYDAPIDQSSSASSEIELCKMSWQGLIAPEWFRQLLVEVITMCPSQTWFFISASTFSKNLTGSGSEIALLRPPEANGEYVIWEIASPE